MSGKHVEDELTYGEVIAGRTTAAIEAYSSKIDGALRNITLAPGDITSVGILTDQFFNRQDISLEKSRFLSERTIAINKKIAEISK